VLQNIRRPEDVLPSHLDYMRRRATEPLPENLLWGRLPIGPGRYYEDRTSGYIATPGLQLYEVKYGPSPEPTRTTHQHLHEEQAYYVVEGRARMILGECTADMGPGSVCYFPPGVQHVFNPVGDQTVFVLDIHGFHYDGNTAKLDIQERRVAPGGGVESSSDDRAEGAYYVISGVATVRVGEEAATIGAGGSAYLPRGVPHEYRNSGSRELVMLHVDNRDV
jgi:mannose-6-phosphate isomerase-like protein (cupin superfamily)